MQIPFVGFQPIKTSEHMASAGITQYMNLSCSTLHLMIFCTSVITWLYVFSFLLGVFALVNVYAVIKYVQSALTRAQLMFFSLCAVGIIFLTVVGLTWAGKQWPQMSTDRFKLKCCSNKKKLKVFFTGQKYISVLILDTLIVMKYYSNKKKNNRIFYSTKINEYFNIVNLRSLMIDTDFAGVIHPWSGRFYSLWDTGYAKIHIPIIASVSEHQPTTWVSFFFDLHILVCAFPAGVWYCVKDINDERVFGETFSTCKIQENKTYKCSWFEFNVIYYQS